MTGADRRYTHYSLASSPSIAWREAPEAQASRDKSPVQSRFVMMAQQLGCVSLQLDEHHSFLLLVFSRCFCSFFLCIFLGLHAQQVYSRSASLHFRVISHQWSHPRSPPANHLLIRAVLVLGAAVSPELSPILRSRSRLVLLDLTDCSLFLPTRKSFLFSAALVGESLLLLCPVYSGYSLAFRSLASPGLASASLSASTTKLQHNATGKRLTTFFYHHFWSRPALPRYASRRTATPDPTVYTIDIPVVRHTTVWEDSRAPVRLQAPSIMDSYVFVPQLFSEFLSCPVPVSACVSGLVAARTQPVTVSSHLRCLPTPPSQLSL